MRVGRGVAVSTARLVSVGVGVSVTAADVSVGVLGAAVSVEDGLAVGVRRGLGVGVARWRGVGVGRCGTAVAVCRGLITRGVAVALGRGATVAVTVGSGAIVAVAGGGGVGVSRLLVAGLWDAARP